MLFKIHSFNMLKSCLSMIFETGQKAFHFSTSPPTVCLLKFPCVKEKKKSQLYFHLPPSTL